MKALLNKYYYKKMMLEKISPDAKITQDPVIVKVHGPNQVGDRRGGRTSVSWRDADRQGEKASADRQVQREDVNYMLDCRAPQLQDSSPRTQPRATLRRVARAWHSIPAGTVAMISED